MQRLLVIVLLVACGGGTKQQGSTATATAPVALELGELKLVDSNKHAAVLVRADGSIVVDGQTVATVTKDGKIVVAGTNETFTLRGDGTITAPDGIPVEVKLTEEPAIKSGDKSISLDASGRLQGANPDAPQLTIEGATTPGLARTALFVLIVFTTPKTKS